METSLENNQEVSLHRALSDQKKDEFPIKGQGTVSVSPAFVDNELRIILLDAGHDCVGLTISDKRVELWMRKAGVKTVLKEETAAEKLLDQSGFEIPYWMSLDTNNKRIRYGKGETLRELMLFEYSWNDRSESPLNELSKDLQRIRIEGTQDYQIKILAMPETLSPSPRIVASSEITMEIISENSASVIDDLPPACRRLYANVAGPGMNLTPPDFPEFAQAIQYSIVTPGALCHTKLAQKDPEFGYLRVTLDSNMGDSPGQPYVLEIWPAGNGSPIHDHGEACAVIKVLHGQIKISWFSALSPEISKTWGDTIAHAGDVTFLTPDYYQIHQLFNPSPKEGGSFCATIQCYRYPDEDLQHYEYFDYIEDGNIKQFLPDSDWSYLEFKQAIKLEWEEVMNGGKKS